MSDLPHSATEFFDILIIGAGLSGIGAAWHVQKSCPQKTYVILEARHAMGGTWDLFRYPGVRSDSDMFTLGYSFRPWTGPKAIADGESILEYIIDTARDHGIEQHVRFRQRVVSLSWSTRSALWTARVESGEDGEIKEYHCRFVLGCSGYYSYDAGYAPDFEGIRDFEGRIVHPQFWPTELDYAGKNVVIIGSGATAITLVPAMAQDAAHVTMLQRSPTYVVSQPAADRLANSLRRILPNKLAYPIVRTKNILSNLTTYALARGFPQKMKGFLVGAVKKELGSDYDTARHFLPRYNPWDQRICAVTDGDLFEAIRAGRVSVVTDQIDAFVPSGLKLVSGGTLDADIVVTATGLRLLFLGGINISVDGRPANVSESLTYKGMMFSDVPNLVSFFGYTNASWTLKCDLVGEYVGKLINYMDNTGRRQCTPRPGLADKRTEPLLDFTSSYVQRSVDQFPKQGARHPWRAQQNYVADIISIRLSEIEDGALEIDNPAPR